MTTIAFLGLGNMGGPMAKNLLAAGHALTVFDLVEAACAAVAAEGASIAASAAEAAEGADVIISMLPAGKHVAGTFLGEDGWLGKARDGFAHGSPLAASWIFRQLNQTREATLEAVFESELILGCNIMRHPEFAEGVRALLVDKDRSPAWAYPDLVSVPADVVDSFFTAPADMPGLGLPE